MKLNRSDPPAAGKGLTQEQVAQALGGKRPGGKQVGAGRMLP